MSNYFNDIELEKLESDSSYSKDGIFNSIIIGAGSNAFRSDRQGIWLGSISFNNAKFSVDMKGNLNSINGTLTGGIFQTATSGARVKIEGNDIILYDDTTGGSTPVTGNTASILFTRTDDKNGDFFIQKRASQNNDSGNVMEFFYNEIASDGYNYIFLGRKGDVSTTPSEWKTDILSVGVSGLIQMSIADRSDSSSIANFNVMTGEYYNDNIGAGTIGNPYLKTDALNINFVGAKGTIDPSGGGVTDTGGIVFSLLEKRGTLTNSKTLAIMDYDSGVMIEKLKMYSFGGTPSIELGGTAITSWNDVKTNLTSIGSNLVPSSNLTYDIGTSSYSWDEIFVRTLSNGGNIYMSLGGILTSYISFLKSSDFNGYNIINLGNLDVNGDIDCEGSADINSFLSIHDQLYMNNTRIHDVQDPSANQDAATKKWVEDNFTPL